MGRRSDNGQVMVETVILFAMCISFAFLIRHITLEMPQLRDDILPKKMGKKYVHRIEIPKQSPNGCCEN